MTSRQHYEDGQLMPRVWAAEEVVLLGRMSDTELAERLGISRATVHNKRKSLGIPTFKGAGVKGPSHPRWGAGWSQDEIALLGTMPDTQLAAMLGKDVSTVHGMRTKRGVAPFVPEKLPKKPGPRPHGKVKWRRRKEIIRRMILRHGSIEKAVLATGIDIQRFVAKWGGRFELRTGGRKRSTERGEDAWQKAERRREAYRQREMCRKGLLDEAQVTSPFHFGRVLSAHHAVPESCRTAKFR